MNPTLTQRLEEAVQETFETMAFLETVPAEETATTLPDDAVAARLAITSPASGVVHLAISDSLVRSIGETLHAVPSEELSAETLQDLLFELVNTMVGMLLNKFLPEDQTYSLGLPEAESSEKALAGQQARFLVDDTPVLVSVDGKILSWPPG